ncbi:ribonuclease HII [Candidatus Peregrinibacteria bacterium]|nr:MAG: ribonuclease HII [Candidatus Peregrinibacteria bacterium]
MLAFEQKFWKAGFEKIIGMDEAGRGPLAGPVYVAGVIFDKNHSMHPDINDSKKLTEKKREELFDWIIENSQSYSIQSLSAQVIDSLNILGAVKKGMRMICKKLEPDMLLTDAVNFQYYNVPQLALVKGDLRSYTIAAASILAKVSRDRKMLDFAVKYPQYGFEKHKGYPTLLHRQMIQQHGLSPIHRKTFNS